MKQSSPETTKLLVQGLLIIVAAFGLPTAVGLAMTEYILERPLVAGLLLLLYWIIVAIVGFITKVWRDIEEELVTITSTWARFKLPMRILDLVGSYSRRYRTYLLTRFQEYDVTILKTQGTYPLLLENVYTPVRLIDTIPHQVPRGLFSDKDSKNNKKSRTIWDIFKSAKEENLRIVVLSPPGSGKTTLLKMVALRLIQRRVEEYYRIPVLIFLRNHAERLGKNPFTNLEELIEEDLLLWRVDVKQDWFQNKLSKGQCLVMFDGLDEIADVTVRETVVDWINRQLDVYAKCDFLVASRPHGLDSIQKHLRGVTYVEVEPYSFSEVEEFISKWYKEIEKYARIETRIDTAMLANRGAEQLIARILTSSTLLKYSSNPMLLTMIATINRYRTSLPERRVELFEELIEVFLERSQTIALLETRMTASQQISVLQPLAYEMMKRNLLEIDVIEAEEIIKEPLSSGNYGVLPDEFLKRVQDESGLLLKISNAYVFTHKSFQEYLAARHTFAHENRVYLVNKLIENLSRRETRSWWYETALLYVAMDDGTKILSRLISESPSVDKLRLAMKVNDEALNIKQEVRNHFKDVLSDALKPNHPWQEQVVEALIQSRLDRFAPISRSKSADVSFVSNSEYMFFLNQLDDPSEHIPDHWDGYLWPQTCKGSDPVTGIRPSDAIKFCWWLTQKDNPEKWVYRLPKSGEIGSSGYSIPLHNDPNFPALYWTSNGSDYKLEPNLVKPIYKISVDTWREIYRSDLIIGLSLNLRILLSMAKEFEKVLKEINRNIDNADEFLIRQIDKEVNQAKVITKGLNTLSLFCNQLERISSDTGALAARVNLFLAVARACTREMYLKLDQSLGAALDHARYLVSYRSFKNNESKKQEVLAKLKASEKMLPTIIQNQLGMSNELLRALGDAIDANKSIALACGLETEIQVDFNLSESAVELAKGLRESPDSIFEMLLHFATSEITLIGLVNIDRYLSQAKAIDRLHVLDIENVFQLAFTRNKNSRQGVKASARALLRFYTLLLALERKGCSTTLVERNIPEREFSALGEGVLCRFYLDLVILEERIRSQLPGVEGLRIIREEC